MFTWGFLLLVGGALASLVIFLGQAADVFAVIGKSGVLHYLERFFATTMTQEKIAFLIAVVLTVLGLVLYIVGLIRCKDEKKSIIPGDLTKYLRDTKGEFKKIVWPTLPTTLRNTGVVLVMCAVTAAIILAADMGLSALMKLLLDIKL